MDLLWYIVSILYGIVDFLMLIRFENLFLKPKPNFKYERIFFYTALSFLICILTGNYFFKYFLYFFLYMITYFAYIFFHYEGSLLKKIFFLCLEPICLGILGFIIQRILELIFWNSNIQENSLAYNYLKTYILYIILYIFINILEMRKNQINPKYKNPYYKNIILILLLNLFFLLSIFYFYCSSNFSKSAFESLLGIIFICIILIILCTIILNNSLIKHLQNEYETMLRLQFNELQQDYYNKITTSSETLRSLRHDLKNHLIVLDGYLANEKIAEARSYINSISEITAESNSIVNLENIMLSSVLTQKKRACFEKKISFNLNVSMGTHSISDMDLCILLGNILDNAIEASEQVPGYKGFIDLEMNDSNEILNINCTNNYKNEPVIHNGRFITGKKNRIMHGIGLKNISELVKKYDGILDYHFENNIFTIDILLKY